MDTTKPTFTSRLVVFAAISNVLLVSYLASHTYPTRNEVAHLPAGLRSLTSGRFDTYIVNPPLSRFAQSLPAWLLQVEDIDPSSVVTDPGGRCEWVVARGFAEQNASQYDTIFLFGRLSGVFWSLLGFSLVWIWSRYLYGVRAALLSTLLWSFGPNCLAHAALATPDLPCAVTCIAASFSFYLFLNSPNFLSSTRTGILLGIALLTKFTVIIEYITYAILILLSSLPIFTVSFRCIKFKLRFLYIVIILSSSIFVVNAGYLFEGSFTVLGAFDLSCRSLTRTVDDGSRVNVFRGHTLGRLPIPLPANFVLGIDLQQADFDGGRQSYLRGELRDRGWWYFYLYALMVKVPVGTLLLGFAGLALSLSRRFRRFDELVVWLPAFMIFAVASAKTGYTMHFRYVIPALPFCLVGLSKVAEVQARWARVAVWVLAGSSVVSSLMVFPHSLAYFNEAAGGPANGAAHLIDSNLDWGQDLYRFKAWHDAHPEARPLHLAYENFVDYRLAGLPTLPGVPRDPADLTPGYYALDIQSLYARGYGHFLTLTPVDRVGYTIRIYHLTDADIGRLKAAKPP